MLVTSAVLAELQADPMHVLYHAGKILNLTGVFMKDMLHLRLLTLIGGICSLAYFFTRQPIIWGAIFWGTVFGLANLNMIVRLALERFGFLRLSAEDRRIYSQHFSRTGITMRQFESFVSQAQRLDVPAGTWLREPKNGGHTDLMLLIDGQVAVCWGEHNQVKRVLEGRTSEGWLGEMGFLLRWSHEGRLPSYSQVIASLITRTPCRILVWSDEEMRMPLNKDANLRRAMLLTLGDTRFQRLLDRSRSDEYASMLAGLLKDGTLAAQDRRMANDFRHKHNLSPWKHEWHINLLGWTIQDWAKGFVVDPERSSLVQEEATASGPRRPCGVLVFNDYSEDHSELAPYYQASFVDDEGVVWPSVTHYVATQRCSIPELQEEIRAAPDAHTLRALLREQRFTEAVREDWASVRHGFTVRATRWKFAQSPHCARVLQRTGDCALLYNHPHNRYWGVGDDSTGENQLGRVLEQVRAELRKRPRRGFRRLLGR